jgi:hypothetical protein
MTTFTIDAENNITALPTGEQVEATATGVQTFTSHKELAQLAADWSVTRLVETWNGFAGVVPFDQLKPVKKFTDRASAVNRIWQAIQKLAPAQEEATEATVAPESADSAPAAEAATKSANPKRKTAKAAKAKKAKAPSKTKSAKPKRAKASSAEAREASKKAEVLALLQRKNGATLSEIMDKMGWQRHTVRGFMAGTLKKAGYAVESFKPEGGERTYRINPK